MLIRSVVADDENAVWSMLEPVIRAGEAYALPRDMCRDVALAYWLAPDHDVFVVELEGDLVGSYYLRPNQQGGGSHVANAGYLTATRATGRGIARAMCEHSIERARSNGYRACSSTSWGGRFDCGKEWASRS